jgi:hypothetical protein
LVIAPEIPELQITDVVAGLGANDFLFVESAQATGLLSSIAATPIGDDQVFLDSWNRLEEDQYMADGGKYRKRRHATYAIWNAGERQSMTLAALLEFGNQVFSQLSGNHQWHIELHQFRIEARDGRLGKPTPEGVHRDGVDFVIVVMIKRVNIDSGATTIFDTDNRQIGEFLLRQQFDMALVNDRRCYHGVTPITQIDTDAEAFREVLVITFKNRESV